MEGESEFHGRGLTAEEYPRALDELGLESHIDSARARRGEPVAVLHAHGNPWRTSAPRSGYSLAVGRDRIVFNAAEITGNVLMGQLPPDQE